MQTSLSRLALPRIGTLALGRNRKVVKAVFSANAQYLALLTSGIYAGEPTRIELWQVPSTRQVATWDVAASARLVSFSDDGRYLAFEVDEESSTMTSVVEVGTGVILRQARRLSRSSVAWTGTGLYLLVAGPQSNIIRVYDEIADRDVAGITESNAIVQTAISSDGRLVATVSAHGDVQSGASQRAPRPRLGAGPRMGVILYSLATAASWLSRSTTRRLPYSTRKAARFFSASPRMERSSG
jgi:hypothetical protein